MDSKEFIVESGDWKGSVDIYEHHSLSDIRSLIINEFDDDMLPSSDFYFCCDGIRVSSKQEQRKLAWDLLGRRIAIHPKKRPSDAPVEIFEKEDTLQCKDKKQRIMEEATAEQMMEKSDGAARNRNVPDNATFNDCATPEVRDASFKEGPMDNEGEHLAGMHVDAGGVNVEPDDSRMYDNDGSAFNSDDDADDDDIANPPNDDFDDSADTESHVFEDDKDVDAPSDEDRVINVTPTELPKMAARPVASNLEQDDDESLVAETIPENNRHEVLDQALEKSCYVLREIESLLVENSFFCSGGRRQEWSQEISQSLAKSAPDTIIGCLGSTGVGKSSLLNALLNEAAVLPTSGSRGCTAAVVELRFNSELHAPTVATPVYKGEVEFITRAEWGLELKLLVSECSAREEQKVFTRPPDPQQKPDAAAAWAKINEVYGRGTMENFHGMHGDQVYNHLFHDRRVTDLLTPKAGSPNIYNSIIVEEGNLKPGVSAKALLEDVTEKNSMVRKDKKRWAKAFRAKINDYVYRKGKGDQPQTWPLIRKVVLHGPWAVLSTGACLVDLPGVRDANAARAKVSEHYLQNCDQIWVVAPIKRAVDDGTAKQLLGEQFKRRLLMDGRYGNVSFICTQTDDCEATEIMRDHQDVAMEKPGRWEEMTELLDEITVIEKEIAIFTLEEDDLKTEHKEATQSVTKSKAKLKAAIKTANVQAYQIAKLQVLIDDKSLAASRAQLRLHSWRELHSDQMQKLDERSRKLQHRLKSLCSMVRSEYSTACLQEDFRTGLKELLRKPDGEDEEEEEGGSSGGVPATVLPENFQMAVHCISANDYLKILSIKPTSDGPPNCFSTIEDTRIPALRAFVHETTAKFRSCFTEAFVNTASDMLDRVKLLSANASHIPSSRLARKFKEMFEAESKTLTERVKPIVDQFKSVTEEGVNDRLKPSLMTGAIKSSSAAMPTVVSWGSIDRRCINMKAPHRNGLHWSTYCATVRRDGAFFSRCAGDIDLNQELCDPMEKEFSADWQTTMDSTIKTLLADSEIRVLELCNVVEKAIASAFVLAEMDAARLTEMTNAASRSCTTAVKAAFRAIFQFASNGQRELNRSLLRNVTAKMLLGYNAAVHVPSGRGAFNRMKDAMENHARRVVGSMFDESTVELLKGSSELIGELASMIAAAVEAIGKNLETVYSVCWDDQTDGTSLNEPEMQRKVRECRDKLLPRFNKLREFQDNAMSLVGIEREVLEQDVMAVDPREEKNENNLKVALVQGTCMNLNALMWMSDSSSDDASDHSSDEHRGADHHDSGDEINSKPAARPLASRVKTEPGNSETPARLFSLTSIVTPQSCSSGGCMSGLDEATEF